MNAMSQIKTPIERDLDAIAAKTGARVTVLGDDTIQVELGGQTEVVDDPWEAVDLIDTIADEMRAEAIRNEARLDECAPKQRSWYDEHRYVGI